MLVIDTDTNATRKGVAAAAMTRFGCLTVQRKVQRKMTATLSDARGNPSGRWISWMRVERLCKIEAEVRASSKHSIRYATTVCCKYL